MKEKKKIFAIIGSASQQSTNQKLVENVAKLVKGDFIVNILSDLKLLPHFNPELAVSNPPKPIIELRNEIEKADGILICTPEYVFGLPSGLKNVFEWCVATTVFSDKPMGIITASASGKQAHTELQLLMKTLSAKFTEETALLIQGVKGKINAEGEITDPKTAEELLRFTNAFKTLLNATNQ